MRKTVCLCCVGAFFCFSENLLVDIVIKMLVIFLAQSLVSFCVSFHIHSSAHDIITTVNCEALALSSSYEDLRV